MWKPTSNTPRWILCLLCYSLFLTHQPKEFFRVVILRNGSFCWEHPWEKEVD